MAGEFLRSHGIDIDAEMARIQNEPCKQEKSSSTTPGLMTMSSITNVSLPNTPQTSTWDVSLTNGHISIITEHNPIRSPSPSSINGHSALLAPSLCHPHIHIDKAYLLSHPKYSHLRIKKGDFAEAMTLTGEAKAAFTPQDLLYRGQRVIDESVAAGVTHMRAFVEVDVGVGTKCLDAGIELKRKAEAEGKCRVQLCAFAQLALFSDASAPAANEKDEDGRKIRDLMSLAAGRDEVEVLGSTPYVETSLEKTKENIDWMISLTLQHNKHLDFHLDYNVDPSSEPLVWYVISQLKAANWPADKTVVLGHCTRLTLFSPSGWEKLAHSIRESNLPITFVGLPTSDLFMFGATLPIPKLIKEYNFNSCLGINNISNAFTPHGSCDPLSLACNGVGLYQARTERDAEMLYECVSTRARKAIGFGEEEKVGLKVEVGDRADVVLFGSEREGWRTRRTVAEAVWVYDSGKGRRGFLKGREIGG